MAKQTAVEWLVEQLLDGKLLMPSLIEEAKRMEKEQIVKAHGNQVERGRGVDSYTIRTGEQYYNETYGKQ